MHNVEVTLYECLHCKGEGTCRNAEGGASCAACIKLNDLKGKSYAGLICRACGGIGKADSMTERLNKRAAPLLAFSIVFGLMFIIFWMGATKNPHTNEIVAFSAGIIGTILGFYFSGKSLK